MAVIFHSSPEPTLGVEVELQIVDLATRQLSSRAPEMLKSFEDNPHVKPELLQSTIELNTGICKDVGEVGRDLTSLMEKIRPICDDLGCAVISAGK